MKTYEDRIAAIKTREDLDVQINRARLAAQAAKRRRYRAGKTLAEKLVWIQAEKHHRDVLHQLRRNYFDIEDKLAA